MGGGLFLDGHLSQTSGLEPVGAGERFLAYFKDDRTSS